MAAVRPVKPVKYFVAVLARPSADLAAARARCCREFGPVDGEAGPWPHTQTRYYEPEMGPGLLRAFWGFANLGDPGRLAQAKLATQAMETEFAEPNGARTVNLDVGYVTEAKTVLATVKDYAHRVYLGEHIYAEVTLIWRSGAWRDLPWTYPDYQTAEYKAFLSDQRQRLRMTRRELATPVPVPAENDGPEPTHPRE